MTKKIPESQYQRIKTDYSKIIDEFTIYLNGYIKALRKGRNSLINFTAELSNIRNIAR